MDSVMAVPPRTDTSRPPSDGAEVQAGQQPAPLLLEEDQRRAKLFVDIVTAVLVLVYSFGSLAAHRNRRIPVGAELHFVELERIVLQVAGLVAEEPLLFGQCEAARPHADEVVREGAPEEGGVATQLGGGPILGELLQLLGLIIHDLPPWSVHLMQMPSTMGLSEVHDRRDDLVADDLKRRDPVHVRDGADHGFDAHTREPAQALDQFAHPLAVLADIEGERAGLLDRIVISALGLTVPAQNVQLLRDLRTRAQAAGVGVARDQAQRLPLTATGDQNRRMWPGDTLWQVERPLQPG